MDLEQNASLDGDADEVAEVETADVADVEQPVTVEGLASEMGWRPLEEWKGDPDKWKPADKFVRSTVDVNHKLSNRLKGVEEQMGRMARTSATMTDRAVAAERERLLKEREEAFDAGDREAFQRTEQELAKVATVTPAVVPDETLSFVERNASWFQKDAEATAWAVTRTNELAATGLGPARQLAIVEREAKQLFPEFFEAEKPKAKPTPLNTPGARSASPARKGFASLPAEAQKEALYFEKKGISREDYAKTWYEEN